MSAGFYQKIAAHKFSLNFYQTQLFHCTCGLTIKHYNSKLVIGERHAVNFFKMLNFPSFPYVRVNFVSLFLSALSPKITNFCRRRRIIFVVEMQSFANLGFVDSPSDYFLMHQLSLIPSISESLEMVRMNSLADALRCINNAEKRGKRQASL